jgi:hypothetical protein
MFKEPAKLSAVERVLYARQISLAEIGEAGQARLCKLAVRVPPPQRTEHVESTEPEAAETLALYLARAGLLVLPQAAAALEREVIAHEPERLPSAGIAALAGRPELEVAAAHLHASFEAVETIKAALRLGSRARLSASLRLCSAPSTQTERSS